MLALSVSLHTAECREFGIYQEDTIATSVIYGTRSLKDTGIRRTDMDSLALRENISVSLAGVLAYNSAVFIKQYGRASLSTVSLRGTSSSHSQVIWNGLKINSPMLGMTDFSLIPAFLTDEVFILHGSSSLQEVSGGLGGAMIMNTSLPETEGFGLQYVQGLGSWLTADEYLKASYKGGKFSTSARIILSTSENDFKFVNMDKKEIAYDEHMNITESWHPTEKNENGKYRDLHILCEAGCDTGRKSEIRLSAWYLDSWRQLPPLSVDYGSGRDYVNEQRERTLRSVLRWDKTWENGRTEASAGFTGTILGYDYAVGNGNGQLSYLTASLSRTGTVQARIRHEHYPGTKWLLTADLSVLENYVDSRDRSVITSGGTGSGYDAARMEMSASASVRWKPVQKLGLCVSIREDICGNAFSPPVPAFFFDFLISEKWNFYLEGSASANYRYPTLNDMYFMPGGNPDLRPESGFSYDLGYTLSRNFGNGLGISAEGGWFDSYIEDWILWMPEGAKKNFWTPSNVRKVHAFGVEQRIRADWKIAEKWQAGFNGSFTWSPSVNMTPGQSTADASCGKQLPYIPEYAASFTARLSYGKLSLLWKWCWYSRRYITSDNDASPSGSVPPYIMNDMNLGRHFDLGRTTLSAGLCINNIFNENYVSVISRPMPGINFEFFIGIKW